MSKFTTSLRNWLAVLVLGLTPALASAYDDVYSYSSFTFSDFRQKGKISVGAIYGSGFGAIATYNINDKFTIDAAGTMELGGNHNIHTWGDILIQNPRMFALSSYVFNWYYGAGVKFRTEYDPYVEEEYLVGPRVVTGLTHDFRSISIEAFTEVALTQYLTQVSESEFGFVLGARYYF